MSENIDNKQEQAKPVRKTPVRKKVEAQEVEVKKEEVKQPVRTKRTQIDANELIPCRSTTHGELIYISKRTGERIVWDDFGNVQDITMGELKNLYSSSPKFITDVLFVIDDEEAVEALNLTKLYNGLFDLTNIEDFFDNSATQMSNLLDKMPLGLRQAIASKAGEKVKNGTLDSRNKIKVLQDKLKIDLLILEEN